MLHSLVHVCCCFWIEFRFSTSSGTEVDFAHSCCCLLSHLVPPVDGEASLAHDFHSSSGSWAHDWSVFLRSRVVKAKFFHQQLFWNFVNAIRLLRHRLFSSVLYNELSWTKWAPCRAAIASEMMLDELHSEQSEPQVMVSHSKIRCWDLLLDWGRGFVWESNDLNRMVSC